jgi:hypothetical protein
MQWSKMPTEKPKYTAETWPIATCLHAFPPVSKEGVALHDAPAEV